LAQELRLDPDSRRSFAIDRFKHGTYFHHALLLTMYQQPYDAVNYAD
jgi:hypothetical protein